jgi:hypothetical protein
VDIHGLILDLCLFKGRQAVVSRDLMSVNPGFREAVHKQKMGNPVAGKGY